MFFQLKMVDVEWIQSLLQLKNQDKKTDTLLFSRYNKIGWG